MSAGELVFRGLRGRTLEDQALAMGQGYGSVAEMAIDELGQIVLDLTVRMAKLESLYATLGHPDSWSADDVANNPLVTGDDSAP